MRTKLLIPRYTIEQFKKDLEEPYAWPGGYPRYFICFDGDALSYAAANDNAELIEEAIQANDNSGWRVIWCDVNWEDDGLFCAHSGERIPSAYGEE
jgi:hypothetical protein